MKSYPIRLVANAFLFKAKKSDVRVSHLKLQKLLFFIHAWGLALHEVSPLLERPQAWPFGPSFETLFHEVKGLGSKNLTDMLTELNPATGEFSAFMPSNEDVSFWNLHEQVWGRYGAFSSEELSALAHEKDGPWEKARTLKVKDIPDDLIKAHYQEKLPKEPKTSV